MMAVSDINCLHRAKRLSDRLYPFFLFHHKNPVTDTVDRQKIIDRFFCHCVRHHPADCRVFAVCQKNRACLCIAYVYMADTVCFFFRPGILMFFNDMI